MASMEALLDAGVAGPVNAGGPGEKDLLAAATAFFKWRQAALKVHDAGMEGHACHPQHEHANM